MIHGLILVNKPTGISSHTVVEKIRKLFKIKKVGHFGTLDPLAEGLLLIGMGHATRFFDYYIKKRKLYSGTITFGYGTTTYDAEGDPLCEPLPVDLNRIDIPALVKQFTGKQMQKPPLFSAKKFKGKPMYKYARENNAWGIEIKPVEVEIHHLEASIIDARTLRFKALTSSGTYIRSLAHDMGVEVGPGAFLQALKREGVGEFNLEDAFTPEELAQQLETGDIHSVVTPIEALLPEFPKIIVSPGGCKTVLNGKPLLPRDVMKIMSTEKSEIYRLFDDEGKLLAFAKKEPKLMRFKPYVVFST